MRRFLRVLLPALVALPLALRADTLQQDTYHRVATALVRVRSQCPSGARQGQGFIVEGGRYVVTARHVVAGCSSLSVDFFGGADHAVQRDTQAATLARAVKASDLALLKLRTPVPNLPSLTWAPEPAPAGTPVYAVARWLGASGITASVMEVAHGSSKLRTHVDGISEVMRELKESNSPSLDLDIVNLTKVITPGTSGAPLVDRQGVVVAIADGGLKGGLAGVNWAIPATYLAALEVSTEALPTAADAAIAQALFAAEPSSDISAASILSCGPAKLVKLKSLSYAECAAVADDQQGLQFLISQVVVNPEVIRFDVYQELSTGAVVVLPEDAALVASGRNCMASTDKGRVTFKLRIENVDNLLDMQMKSLAFERDFLGQEEWLPVPSFSYLLPITRYDGLIANRKMLATYPETMPLFLSLPSANKGAFETLASRGGTLLSYLAQVDLSGHDLALELIQCPVHGAPPACADFNRLRRAWDAAVLSVFLSTFSRGNPVMESEEGAGLL